MLQIITHAFAILVGVSGGWFLKGKYGAKVDTAIQTEAKKL